MNREGHRAPMGVGLAETSGQRGLAVVWGSSLQDPGCVYTDILALITISVTGYVNCDFYFSVF